MKQLCYIHFKGRHTRVYLPRYLLSQIFCLFRFSRNCSHFHFFCKKQIYSERKSVLKYDANVDRKRKSVCSDFFNTVNVSILDKIICKDRFLLSVNRNMYVWRKLNCEFDAMHDEKISIDRNVESFHPLVKELPSEIYLKNLRHKLRHCYITLDFTNMKIKIKETNYLIIYAIIVQWMQNVNLDRFLFKSKGVCYGPVFISCVSKNVESMSKPAICRIYKQKCTFREG